MTIIDVCCYFNPRSHEGSDPSFRLIPASYSRFQSTLPRGERRLKPPMIAYRFLFQSTLPRGERLHPVQRSHQIQYFNPRSHEGSDAKISKSRCFWMNFNPRSHEGSDAVLPWAGSFKTISIHAPTRGATSMVHTIEMMCIFQSTLPRGERQQFSSYAGCGQ